jgi:hypothetical protein
LLNTPAGNAALVRNLFVTNAIQTGSADQPAVASFRAQEAQALRDAFITGGNARELADGLGTKLGAVYQAAVRYTSSDDGKTSRFTSISPRVAALIGYTFALTGADSGNGKYFFADETVMTGTTPAPVSTPASRILAAVHGTTDVFGKAYRHPAGHAGADRYGNSRPFQTEATHLTYQGRDYFGVAASNDAYLQGPTQQLRDSPAFPSGHTTYGYTESLLLAIMVPERFSQMIVRGAEYGNSRIVLGAHFAMDVIAGRTLAYYDVAQLLAENPLYIGQTFGQFTVGNFRTALGAARSDLRRALAAGCAGAIAVCAGEDTSRFHDAHRNRAFYESTQNYGLPVVYPGTALHNEDVATLAPEAGRLLTAPFPELSLARADRLLTETEGPGGGFLDNGSTFGVYSRLNLYAAGRQAAALAKRRSSRE